MVESDTARVSDLPMVESDTARVSVLPVAGCKFPAIFLGKVALGCGWSGRWPAVSTTWTLILSGWRLGRPAGCSAIVASFV